MGNPGLAIRSPLVREAMTPAPATLHATQSLRAAQRIFADKAFQHLIVVRGQRPVGVISDRDLSTFLTKHPHLQDLEVTQAMTPDPKLIRADAPAGDAARLLLEHRIHCLPVVDTAGNLCGILTPTDLLRVLVQLLSSSPA